MSGERKKSTTTIVVAPRGVEEDLINPVWKGLCQSNVISEDVTLADFSKMHGGDIARVVMKYGEAVKLDKEENLKFGDWGEGEAIHSAGDTTKKKGLQPKKVSSTAEYDSDSSAAYSSGSDSDDSAMEERPDDLPDWIEDRFGQVLWMADKRTKGLFWPVVVMDPRWVGPGPFRDKYLKACDNGKPYHIVAYLGYEKNASTVFEIITQTKDNEKDLLTWEKGCEVMFPVNESGVSEICKKGAQSSRNKVVIVKGHSDLMEWETVRLGWATRSETREAKLAIAHRATRPTENSEALHMRELMRASRTSTNYWRGKRCERANRKIRTANSEEL